VLHVATDVVASGIRGICIRVLFALFVKYYYDDQNEDDMGGACNTLGEYEISMQRFVRKLKSPFG
jgi:hypothetical protein